MPGSAGTQLVASALLARCAPLAGPPPTMMQTNRLTDDGWVIAEHEAGGAAHQAHAVVQSGGEAIAPVEQQGDLLHWVEKTCFSPRWTQAHASVDTGPRIRHRSRWPRCLQYTFRPRVSGERRFDACRFVPVAWRELDVHRPSLGIDERVHFG